MSDVLPDERLARIGATCTPCWFRECEENGGSLPRHRQTYKSATCPCCQDGHPTAADDDVDEGAG